MTRKPPAHLIRPIIYPTSGNSEYRDSKEIAAINDEHLQPKVQEEIAEALRVAGVPQDEGEDDGDNDGPN